MLFALLRISATDMRREGKRILAEGSRELLTVIAGIGGAESLLVCCPDDPASTCGVTGLAATELLGDVTNFVT